jgi:prepilin-type N-terminal cleavage/methylation domain-containing protein
MRRARGTCGATLLELLVVLVILGIMYASSAVALSRADADTVPTARLAQHRARSEAIHSGRPVRWSDSLGQAILYLPDGREAVRSDVPTFLPEASNANR